MHLWRTDTRNLKTRRKNKKHAVRRYDLTCICQQNLLMLSIILYFFYLYFLWYIFFLLWIFISYSFFESMSKLKVVRTFFFSVRVQSTVCLFIIPMLSLNLEWLEKLWTGQWNWPLAPINNRTGCQKFTVCTINKSKLMFIVWKYWYCIIIIGQINYHIKY